MRKFLLIGLGVVVLVIAVFAIVVAMQPSTFAISRSVVIDAPASRVFPYLNNVYLAMDWSPFEKLDPQMKRTFAGPNAGVGASYSWDGNDEAGAGTATIIESRPDEFVKMKLDFTRPMEATNYATYTVTPAGEDQVRVTWEMTGENTFISKAVCMLMDLDAMIGPMFEEGLGNLKKVAMTMPKLKAVIVKDGTVEVVASPRNRFGWIVSLGDREVFKSTSGHSFTSGKPLRPVEESTQGIRFVFERVSPAQADKDQAQASDPAAKEEAQKRLSIQILQDGRVVSFYTPGSFQDDGEHTQFHTDIKYQQDQRTIEIGTVLKDGKRVPIILKPEPAIASSLDGIPGS